MTPPFQLDGFDILEKLGTGGMATVWKARQQSLDRIVAIKVLSGLQRDPEDIRRFEEEARSAAKLRHHGIVQVYDANVSEGNYYIVMEFISGYTVGEWVRKKHHLSEDDALLVAENVALALGYAWEREGLIHCDIKPDNVMIDGDGTVKVADLGLARTIQEMGAVDETGLADEIMGTPAYIAPEQAAGAIDLDCRTDIYSLGAMLYHLLTGHLMFQGLSEMEVLEGQVNGHVDDPTDLNPDLSMGVCWLLERMLSKDRDFRPADWEATVADIRRVRSGSMPEGCERLVEGNSTVRRSPARTMPRLPAHDVGTQVARLRRQQGRSRLAWIRLLVLLLLLAGSVVLLVKRGGLAGLEGCLPDTGEAAVVAAGAGVTDPGGQDENEVEAAQEARAAQSREALQRVLRWSREHPDAYDEAERRLREVARDAAGTTIAPLAHRAAEHILKRRAQDLAAVREELEAQVRLLVGQEDFVQAETLLQSYEGRLAELSAPWRRSRAEAVRREREAAASRKVSQAAGAAEAFRAALADVTDAVLKGDMAGAAKRFRAARLAAGVNVDGIDVDAVERHLAGACGVREAIAESFRRQIGSDVAVEFSEGPRKMRILAVSDATVSARVALDASYRIGEISFTIDELSQREWLSRMGSEEDAPGIALVKGSMALEAKAYEHARRFYSLAPPDLARMLVPAVKTLEEQGLRGRVVEELRALLAAFGVHVGAYDHALWLRAAVQAPASYLDPARVSEGIRSFRLIHGAHEMGREVDDILQALERAASAVGAVPDPLAVFEGRFLRPPLPSFRREAEHVQPPGRSGPSVTLPLRPGLEGCRNNPAAVCERLVMENPGVGVSGVRIGKLEMPGGWSGLCVEIRAPGVREIGAVRALGDLRGFCYDPGPGQRGMLVSLLALGGLPIEYLMVAGCTGVELSAFRDAPLRYALLPNSSVGDLAPLQGAPLLALDISGSRVSDLRPVALAPLRYLVCDRSGVTRLEPLSGMRLHVLSLAGTRVVDFAVLGKLRRLRYLNLSDTFFRDLQQLSPWNLMGLDLSGTRVRELDRLQSTPISHLSLARTSVKDFSALAFLPLESLSLADTGIDRLDCLAATSLTQLDLTATKVSDLSPLARLPLCRLSLRNTSVVSLEPLRGMPLEALDLRGTPVRDLAPITGAPLVSLAVDHPASHPNLAGQFPNLRFLNGQPFRAIRAVP